MSAAPIRTHIVGPADWAAYLINGDSMSMDADEKRAADLWLEREGVAIEGTEPDAEPYYSNSGRLLVPELGCDGFLALDYRAREVRLEAEEAAEPELGMLHLDAGTLETAYGPLPGDDYDDGPEGAK